jgi:hypothetical protein
MLWTPGYWGWNNGAYMWNDGYWGPQVGFYGGIDYGFGYTGRGYEGGYWRGHDFYYNRNVNNVNVTNIHNVYNKTVIVNNRDRVSYNGGRGGIGARPTAEQERFRSEHHVEATAAQQRHVQEASHNRELFARNNGGKPAIAATARPGDFQHAVPAKAVGGRVDRASLNANSKTAAARPGTARANEPARPATNSRNNNEANTRGREVPRPANATSSRNETPRTETSHNVPKPPSATNEHRTNENARTTARPSAATPLRNENARTTSHPTSAAPARNENAHNVPKPPSASHSENAHVNSPSTHAETAPKASAASHETTPRPATARPERESNTHASAGMPQGEGAPKGHSSPAPHSAPSHESAAPSHAPASHQAPAHENAAPSHANTHAAPAAKSEGHPAAAPKASAPKENDKKPK